MRMGIQTVRLLALSAIMFTVLLTGGVWSPRAATAATYYVALTGNDANPGTQTQPFGTIAKGISVLHAGDTLYVRGGNYNESIATNNYNIPAGTSWSNPVTIAGYPGETVTLPSIGGNFNASEQYIIFMDFVVTGAQGGGIGIVHDAGSTTPGDSYVRFQNIDVHDWTSSGNAPPGFYIFANHVEVLGGKVHNSPVGAACSPDTQADCHGFYIIGAYNLIDGVEIYNNSGYGIHLYNGYNPTFNHDNIIRNNRVHNNYIAPSCCGGGILISRGANNMAYNNIVYNNRSVNGIAVGYQAVNNQVYNNTVYGNGGYGISVDSVNTHGGTTGTIVRNNIVYGNVGGINDLGVSTTQDHNFTSNPNFVDVAAANFHLQAGSPAIDAGITLSAVTTDIAGTSRPQGAGY